MAALTVDDANRQIALLFAQAIRSFERETGQKLYDNNLKHFATVDEFAAELEARRTEFGRFRKHDHPNLFKHLRLALKPVELLGNIAAAGASTAFPASGPVFNAINYLITSTDGVSLTYDIIEVLFKKIEDVNANLDILSRHELPPELRSKLGELLVAIIRICALSRKLSEHGRFLTYAKGVLTGKDKDVSEQLAVFDRLQSGLSSRVEALSYDSILSSQAISLDIQDTLRQNGEKETAFREEVRASLKHDNMKVEEVSLAQAKLIADVLRPSSRPMVIFNNFNTARAKSTGAWVVEHHLYKDWLFGTSPILRISGGPGTGKSSLSSYIIEQLQDHDVADSHEPTRKSVAYFFFKEAESELRSFDSALRTMAFELSRQDPTFFKHLYTICSTNPGLLQNASLSLLEVLQPFYGKQVSQREAILVFDGLDEADAPELAAFSTTLSKLRQKGLANLKVLLVGRTEVTSAIEGAFGDEPPELRLSSSTNMNDIVLFVKENLSKLPHYGKMSKKTQEDIRATLIEKADGMFLWVQLMLNELRPYKRSDKIRSVLEEAPRSVADVISHILERLSRTLKGDDLDEFNEVLSWTTWARRPLTVWELEMLVRISNNLDDDEQVGLEEPLRSSYSSFFTITEEYDDKDHNGDSKVVQPDGDGSQKAKASFWDEQYSENGDSASDSSYEDEIQPMLRVNFAHVSIRQYFQLGVDTKVENTGIDLDASKTYVLHLLLRVMVEWEKWRAVASKLAKEGEDEPDDDQSKSSRNFHGNDEAADQYSGLVQYAASNWLEHLRAVKVTSVPTAEARKIAELLLKLFSDRRIIWMWMGSTSDFAAKWLDARENRTVVCSWLRECKDLVTAAQAEQILSLSAETLLDAAMDVLAWAWLENPPLEWKCRTLYEYLERYHREKSPDKFPALATVGSSTSSSSGPTPQERTEAIYRVARLCRPTETLVWHNGVSIALRQFHLFDQAQAEVEKSVAMQDDPNHWRAYWVKGWTYAFQRRLEDAVPIFQACIKEFEERPKLMEDMKQAYWDIRFQYAEWAFTLKRYPEALHESQAILDAFPERPIPLQNIINILELQGSYAEAIQLLRKLDCKNEKGQSRLEISLGSLAKGEWDVFMNIFDIARMQGELQWALDLIERLARNADPEDDFTTWSRLQFWICCLFEKYLNRRTDAVDLLEGTITRIGSPKRRTTRYETLLQLSYVLGNIYIDEASTGKVDDARAEDMLQRLRKVKEALNADPVKEDDSLALQLGTLHRLRKQDDLATAYFRTLVQAGVALLEDNDDSNDFDAYNILADCLLATGPAHEDDCLAAHSLLAQDHSDAKGWAGRTEPELVYCVCSVDSKDLLTTGGWWTCKICVDVSFCEECMPKVKDGTVGIRVCNPKHDWLYVPKVTERPPKKTVLYKGEQIAIQEWLGKLKKTWKIV